MPAKSKKTFTVGREELLSGGTDTAFRTFIHELIAYAARIQEVRATFGEHIGLTGVQYTILIAILHMSEEEHVGVNAIAQHLHLSGAFVTNEINKLVRHKLVRKDADSNDKRRVQLQVTETGRELLGKLSRIQAPVNDALFSSLSRDEFTQTATMVKRLLAHADEAIALLSFLRKTDATSGNKADARNSS